MSDGKVNAYLAQMETMPADVQRRILLWLMELERRRLALLRAIQENMTNYWARKGPSWYTPDFEGPGF
jgi:hypothetical protein